MNSKKTLAQYYTKQLAIPLGFHSRDEMLGCTIHAVNIAITLFTHCSEFQHRQLLSMTLIISSQKIYTADSKHNIAQDT